MSTQLPPGFTLDTALPQGFEPDPPAPTGIGDIFTSSFMRGAHRVREDINLTNAITAEQDAADIERAAEAFGTKDFNRHIKILKQRLSPTDFGLASIAIRDGTTDQLVSQIRQSAAEDMADARAAQIDAQQYPQPQSMVDVGEAIQSGKGFMGTADVFTDNLLANITGYGSESLPRIIPPLLAAPFGAVPALATTAASTTAMERAATTPKQVQQAMVGNLPMQQAMQESVIAEGDPTGVPMPELDQENIRILAQQNPELLTTARQKADRRALTMGAAETAGLRGGQAIARALSGSGGLGTRVGGQLIAESALDPVVGAGGEALATLAEGEEINTGELAVEAFAELFGVPVSATTSLVSVARESAAKRGKPVEDVTINEIEEDTGTPATEILRSAGMSDEQIAAIDQSRQQEMANIVEARREEEAARGAPQDAAGFNNQGARRTKEGVLLDRQPRGSVWEDVVRQQKQDEKIALGEMDPAVAPETGRVREPLPDVMPVTPEGQVDVGDAGTAAGIDMAGDVKQETDRRAQQAFDLADRQRQRAGEGVADTQTAGRPEGAAQFDVVLDQGFPVRIIDRQYDQATKQNLALVERYDPRTGEVEPGSEQYIVPEAQLTTRQYATEPRRAQDVEARSQVDRVARGKAKGQRIDEFQDLPRQTYRTTEPDPEVQGAEGPFTDVQDRGPGVRADRPPQDEGPSPFKERSTTEEEAIRQAEAFAKEQAQKERARQERAEQARQRGEEPQPEFEDDGGEFESRKSTIKPAKVGKDGYYPTHDYKGVRYVLSDGGGPIIFGTQKQAAKWINKVANIAANDDQFFVFATHPFKQGKPDAKGMSESLYTVVETKRNPEGRKESAQEQAQEQPRADRGDARRATFAEADAAERASDARRRAQSEPGQQRGIPGEVLEAEPEPEPQPQPQPQPEPEQPAAPPGDLNPVTQERIEYLNSRADQIDSRASEQEQIIKDAEGKTLDLDANRDQEFRDEAAGIAKNDRESAAKLRKEAQELQQFFSTPDGQRLAREIDEIGKQAEDAGLDRSVIDFSIKSVPRQDVDKQIEFARNQLETLRQRMMGQTGQMPPIPHTPIKDVGEILDPMSKEQGEGSQSSITAEEKKQIIDKINPLLKKLNEMGYNVKDSLDPGNATQAAIDLKRKIIELAQVQHELGQQRLREDKNIKKISMQGSFSPTKLKFWEEQFDELVGTRDYVRPGSEARDPIQRNDMEKDTAVLNSGEEFPVQYAVVEADELITSQNDDGTVNRSYPQELQPRDRSRGASEMQIQDIANNPNPRLLDKSAKASDGAMIITDEGVVVSGNGRTLGLRRAYDNDNANNYRDHLKQQGYPVDDKVNPVLVRVYQGDPDQLARIAREANERDTMAMSSTEQAMSDARAMSDEVVSLYKGGDIDSAANAAFVRGFIDDVVGRADEAAIRQEGRLSQDGIRRIQSALLAKAFGDENVVSAMTESADNNIKAIGGAMMDVAGVWSQMRQAIQSGNVDPDMDVTEFLLQAVQTVKRARNEKRNIAEFIGQGDIFGSGGIDPLARDFLNLMFRDTKEYGGRSHIGRDKVAEALRFYANEAQKQQAGPGLFGEEAKASPSQILKAAKGKQGGTKQQSEDLFASSEGGFQEGDTTTRQQRARSQGEGSTETAGETKVNQNPTGPKFYGFPGPLFDKEVYKDISRDLKKVLKATTSLTGAVTRPIRNIARSALASSDQHMRADLKERGLLTPTAEKILNMFHAEAGKAGEVDQTFFEAVESRAGEQYNKLSRALGKYVDDAESVAQIVKLLRGNPRALRAGTPLHDAAIEVRKILDENLQYMREAGVEIGEVKTGYFPREMDTDIVMRNQGGFELAAAQAYRETGMNAKAARDAAAALYEELIFGHLNSPRQGGGASAPFVRGRVFTKAVDNESHPLNKFLVQDHVGSLTQYLGRAARRGELARRFGDNFANMADLEQQLKDEGSGEIIPELAAHIETMTGTAMRGQKGDLKMLQNIRMWSALMYLERATLSSLGEIVMPAVRTGNALDLGSAFAQTIKGFRKQNKSEARDMAEDLGIITGHVGESIMTSRYAGEDISGQKTARVLDRYFRRIGLEQFTEATRVASTKIGNVFIRRMAKRIAAGGKQAKLSTEFLAELGVPAAKAQEFSAWMMKSDGFPTDISGEMGSIYKKAIWRFVDQTIMRPNKSVKPKWANSNLGQVVYHLQAFTLTFYQNVVKRSGRLAKRAFTERGLSVPDRARLVAPALMLPVLFAFQAAISEIRDELTMDEERRKKETGTTRALKWASRTGLFGAADPYVNLVQASSRYNRSAIDSLIGPGLGAAGKAADATLAVTLNDSPTTNTQERKMMRAFYDVALEPMLNYQLSQRIGPAAGPIARATGAAITQIAGAGKTKEVFLSATAGPYKKKTESGRPAMRTAREPRPALR